MIPRYEILGIVLIALIFPLAACSDDKGNAPATGTGSPSEAGVAEAPDTTPPVYEGGIGGRVTYNGRSLASKTLYMRSDPQCVKLNPSGLSFRKMTVGDDGGVSDAFIYVTEGLEGRSFRAPKEKAVLDQRGCWYFPRVSGVMVGQTIEVLNSDTRIMHNVNARPDFNVPMAPGVPMISRTFDKPAIMRRIKCNVHPWMTAFVGVLEHPFFAVSAEDGSYEIKGLPPGTYTLKVWHEWKKLGAAPITVTVKDSVVRGDIKLSKKDDS